MRLPVQSKSVYEPKDETDEWRVLTTQYWPRGISKDAVDEYVRILAPTRPLLHAFKKNGLSWAEYRDRYLKEMQGELQQAEIHRLAKLARSQKVTLLCVCKYEDECHRSLLRDLITQFEA
jgi:uncharacterized protein YeaO (DUF488 family)